MKYQQKLCKNQINNSEHLLSEAENTDKHIPNESCSSSEASNKDLYQGDAEINFDLINDDMVNVEDVAANVEDSDASQDEDEETTERISGEFYFEFQFSIYLHLNLGEWVNGDRGHQSSFAGLIDVVINVTFKT